MAIAHLQRCGVILARAGVALAVCRAAFAFLLRDYQSAATRSGDGHQRLEAVLHGAGRQLRGCHAGHMAVCAIACARAAVLRLAPSHAVLLRAALQPA